MEFLILELLGKSIKAKKQAAKLNIYADIFVFEAAIEKGKIGRKTEKARGGGERMNLR